MRTEDIAEAMWERCDAAPQYIKAKFFLASAGAAQAHLVRYRRNGLHRWGQEPTLKTHQRKRTSPQKVRHGRGADHEPKLTDPYGSVL